MRLTRAAEYAIRCMVYLASKGRGVLVLKQEIADHGAIPGPFLAKIVQDLARANLIEIRQGPKGGYLLTREPARITLLEVVEAMIGRIQLNDCVGRPESCPVSARCRVHGVWEEAASLLRGYLGGITFAELAADASCLPGFSVHNKTM